MVRMDEKKGEKEKKIYLLSSAEGRSSSAENQVPLGEERGLFTGGKKRGAAFLRRGTNH